MAEHLSPRVNSARLADLIGRTVRIWCKVLRGAEGPVATVQASDGGEIEVKLVAGTEITTTFVEFIGTVLDASTLKMMAVVPLSDNTNLANANVVSELWHDPRFAGIVF